MGMFSGLFKSKENVMQKQATSLVPAARVNATTLFVPFLDKYPFLGDVDIEQWDFVLTIAGVFMAASRLNQLRVGNTREESLMETVAESLVQWKSDALQGFEDCKKIFEAEYDRLAAAGHEPRFIASDSVGKWIVLNVLGRTPKTDAECNLVREIGVSVTGNFFNWWGS